MTGKPRVAFLFPGQGSLPDRLPPTSALIDDLYAIAADAGLRIRQWLEEENRERLVKTDAAQPAILIDSLAREAKLREAGIEPVLVAGHSLGEYSALASAGVLHLADALDLVIARGAAMADVPGTMAAVVKLDLETVARLCEEVGPDVVVANHNGHRQVVVSGLEDAVGRVAAAAGEVGGRGIPLRVSGPFHSPFMDVPQERFAQTLDHVAFHTPSCPVICAVNGLVETGAETLRNLMRIQMTSCVHWVDVVEQLVRQGVTHAVEVGTGDVLTNLSKRITDQIRFIAYEEALDGTL